MNLNKKHITKLSIIVSAVLLVGLFVILNFVQKQQNTRSKASPQDAYNALDVTDQTGNPLEHKDENGLRTYETQSLDVKIRVNDLEKLTNEP